MKNKQVKQMICSVLNRNGSTFGYYSLVLDWRGEKIQSSYALRHKGAPIQLALASIYASVRRGSHGY